MKLNAVFFIALFTLLTVPGLACDNVAIQELSKKQVSTFNAEDYKLAASCSMGCEFSARTNDLGYRLRIISLTTDTGNGLYLLEVKSPTGQITALPMETISASIAGPTLSGEIDLDGKHLKVVSAMNAGLGTNDGLEYFTDLYVSDGNFYGLHWDTKQTVYYKVCKGSSDYSFDMGH
jgi:hypothetical protein